MHEIYGNLAGNLKKLKFWSKLLHTQYIKRVELLCQKLPKFNHILVHVKHH